MYPGFKKNLIDDILNSYSLEKFTVKRFVGTWGWGRKKRITAICTPHTQPTLHPDTVSVMFYFYQRLKYRNTTVYIFVYSDRKQTEKYF